MLPCYYSNAPSNFCARQDQTRHKSETRGVLIDTSPHQKNVIEFEREVVSAIAERFEGLGAESFVISYASKVNLLQD